MRILKGDPANNDEWKKIFKWEIDDLWYNIIENFDNKDQKESRVKPPTKPTKPNKEVYKKRDRNIWHWPFGSFNLDD